MVEAGANVKKAQLLARHATPEMTVNTSTRGQSERLSAVADAVGRNLRANIAGAQPGNGKSANALSANGFGEWAARSIPAAPTSYLCESLASRFGRVTVSNRSPRTSTRFGHSRSRIVPANAPGAEIRRGLTSGSYHAAAAG